MRTLLISLALAAGLPAQTYPLAQRQADLEWVRAELPRRHPNLFTVTPRADYDRAAIALRDEAASLSDEQFYMRLSALVALGRDAHTALGLGGPAFPNLALMVRWFDDGVFVSASTDVALNAARLIAINGVPTEEVMERLRAVIPYENDLWFRARAQAYLPNLGVLRGVNVVPEGEAARFTMRLANGAIETRELALRTTDPVRPIAQTPGFTPALLRRLDENYWAEYWPATQTLYIAYRRCAETPSKPIAQFVNEIAELARRAPVSDAVIDLRGNPGGNSLYFDRLLQGLQQPLGFLMFQPNFRAYGLIDRGTFSSGMLAALLLKVSLAGIVPLYGEPTGGSPTGYGEVVTFALPGSGLLGQHSTRFFNLYNGARAIPPDVAVGFRSSDYFSRQDPLLALVFARSAPGNADASGELTTWNGASLRPDAAIAPGSIATAFGALTGEPVTVHVNGIAADVVGVAPWQVSFVVPPALEPGLVTVEAGGKQGRFRVSRWSPALFSAAPGNALQPAAGSRDEGVVRLYATGLGGPGAVRAWIAETPVDVLRAEPVSGIAGLWLVETKLPENVSGFVPAFLAAGDQASNAVSLTL